MSTETQVVVCSGRVESACATLITLLAIVASFLFMNPALARAQNPAPPPRTSASPLPPNAAGSVVRPSNEAQQSVQPQTGQQQQQQTAPNTQGPRPTTPQNPGQTNAPNGSPQTATP